MTGFLIFEPEWSTGLRALQRHLPAMTRPGGLRVGRTYCCAMGSRNRRIVSLKRGRGMLEATNVEPLCYW